MESIETTYRLSDMFAVTMRAWRTYLRAFILLEIFFVGMIVVPGLIEGWGTAAVLRYADWVFPICAGLFLILAWFGLCPLLAYWRTKRQRALGPNRFRLESDGIRVEAPRAESLIYWPSVKRVIASRQRLFLFVTNSSALIIPRRSFDSDEEFAKWAKGAEAFRAAVEPAGER